MAVRAWARRVGLAGAALLTLSLAGLLAQAHAVAADPPSVIFTAERPGISWSNAEPEATLFVNPDFQSGKNDGGTFISFIVTDAQAGFRTAEFVAPAGQTLHVGTYTHVGTVFDSTAVARMETDYRCREAPDRTFTIHEISWDGDELASLAVDYACLDDAPIYYQLRFHSRYPVSPLASAPVRAAFPRTLAGQHAEMDVTVTGVGPGEVHPGTAKVTGDAAPDLAITHDGCAGTTLQVGATCSLSLRFSPVDGPQVDRTAQLVVPLDSLAGYRAVAIAAPITRPTSLVVVPDRNPATMGNPVTFTAVITPQPPGTTPVQWLVDGSVLNQPSSNQLQTNRIGQYTIAAKFLGTEGYAPSESVAVAQSSYQTSSVAWTVYPSFNAPPGVLDLFAIVSAGSAFPPGGTLTITDETTGTVLAQASAGNGQLSISLQRVSLPGLHLLRADYTGVAPWILPSEAPILVEGTPSTDPAPVARLFAGGFASLARAGTAGTLTVDALDARSGLAPQYRGTVHVTSSDPAADLPSDHTFTGDDGGSWRVPVTLHTLGEQTVTITDTVTGDLVAVGRVVVGPAFTADEVRPVDLSVGAQQACAIAADGVVECWGSTANHGLGWHGTAQDDAPGPVGTLSADAVDVAVGGGHACAALADGTVWCWGANDYGQAPPGDHWGEPAAVSGVANAVAVSAGAGHACALAGGGTVICWGGLLGVVKYAATSVAGLTGATAIASGDYHACALLVDRSVRCWGSNTKGQLGNGGTADSAEPVAVSGITDAVAIAADGNASCAVLSGGTIRCWGENVAGRLGDGSTTDRTTPVAVAGIRNATGVTLGVGHACARLDDASIRCWGLNDDGQLGDGSTVDSLTPVTVSLDGVLAIDAGGRNTCAILAHGMRCWGKGDGAMLGSSTGATLQPVAPTGLPAGAVPAEHGPCALTPSGTVMCWGPNWGGQLGDGTVSTGSPVPVTVSGIDDAVAIADNGVTTCVVRTGGTVWCWPWNVATWSGGSPSIAPLPNQVPGVVGATAVDLSSSHACALLADTTVMCWGDNMHGEIGNGTTSYAMTPPTPVSGLTGVVQLALSQYASCARLGNGTIECWGEDGSLQLGRAAPEGDTTLPAPVVGIATAVDISAYDRSVCAVLADGHIRCWGFGGNWELGNGAQNFERLPVEVIGVSDAVDVTLGSQYGCARSANGTVRCWGRNGSGQLGDGTTLDRSTEVVVPGVLASHLSAGSATCVQNLAGAVQCWGAGSVTGDGHWPYASRPVAVAWRTTPRLTVTLETPAVSGTLNVPVILTAFGGDADIAAWYVDAVEMSPGLFWWDPQNPLPTTFTLAAGDDQREIHGFVRDVRGGWSSTAIALVRIDTTPPQSGATLPAVTRTLQVPITVAGQDTGTGITGWLVSAVPLWPSASDPRWVTTAPTTATLTGGDGTRRLYVWTRDGAGNVSVPAAPKTLLDTLPPYGGGAPTVVIRGAASATTLPIQVSWPAARDGQAGALRYELSVLRTGTSSYASVSLADPTVTAVSLALRSGGYRFRVRAIDRAGNAGPWHAAAAAVTISLVQESSPSIKYSCTFTKAALSGASGGAVRAAGRHGCVASLTVTARGVAFVTTRGPSRGKAEVWLDGRRVATIDMYAVTVRPASIAWTANWGALETHRVQIVVLGSKRAASSSTRVDIDAFALLR